MEEIHSALYESLNSERIKESNNKTLEGLQALKAVLSKFENENKEITKEYEKM